MCYLRRTEFGHRRASWAWGWTLDSEPNAGERRARVCDGSYPLLLAIHHECLSDVPCGRFNFPDI